MNARVASRLGVVYAMVASLALACVALAAPGAGVAAPTDGCSRQWHSKAVVKRVRRHGHPRRVRRVKHWWTCKARPLALTPESTLPAPSAPEAPAVEEPQVAIPRLGVKAVEYSYTLSRPEVGAGEVIVELNNQGEDPHNLVLEHEGSADPLVEIPATPSLSQASARFSLSSGTYRLYCSLYKHEAKGMEATLVVNGT